ncbi:MAG: tRNA guanosine(34) transglycosylase Tgt [bacterium]|nr:tRNA guanosine(34) transglycosylase Tgt [bacterium]
MASFFKFIGQDKKSRARAGILKTSHGEIQTPVFVPVGTKGTVKSLTCEDLSNIGVQIFLANTYHLYLRPGVDVVEKLGGLHGFTGWNKPLMTDSGGFQVFSLASLEIDEITLAGPATRHLAGARSANKPLRASKVSGSRRHPLRAAVAPLVKIDDDGVTFRSHLDGSLHRFTPETSIEVQQKLGADIILAFDECPPYGVEKDKVRKAMERTHKWAVRSLKATHGRPFVGKQLLFGIVQGGVFKDLREESAKFIASLPFDGIAIGGVAVGESKREMVQVLDWVIPHLPDEKPRHLLGVGEIDDLFEAVARGIDMFDCVMPTRLGRMGQVLTNDKLQMVNGKWHMDIIKAKYATDPKPIMHDCRCYVCQNYSRAYINHLFRSRELLAYRLATYHNLWFMTDLMRQIREAIIRGEFLKLKKDWLG